MYYKLIDSFEVLNDTYYLNKILQLYFNSKDVFFDSLIYVPEVLLDYGYDISAFNFNSKKIYDIVNKEHLGLFLNSSMICYQIEKGGFSDYIEIGILNQFLNKINGINEHYNELSKRLNNGATTSDKIYSNKV